MSKTVLQTLRSEIANKRSETRKMLADFLAFPCIGLLEEVRGEMEEYLRLHDCLRDEQERRALIGK